MSTAVIRAEGLGKRYQRGVEWHPGLRHWLEGILRSPLSVFRQPKQETFWALRDVSLKLGAKLFAEKPREIAREIQRCLKDDPDIVEQCLRQA